MTGTITRIIEDKGYAFLRDTEGGNRFVHRRNLCQGLEFEALEEGLNVEFDPIGDGPNNLRAINVRIIASERASA